MTKQPAIPQTKGDAQEAETERSQALANALFYSIGDGAITTDIDGRISQINQAALEMLGFAEKEVLKKPFLKILHETDEGGNPINALDRSITEAFVTGKPISSKSYYQKKDGTRLPAFVTVSPIILDGLPVGAVQVFHDISLEQEVDRMKSEFISIASHQLRAPLTAVKTYTHLLANGYAGPISEPQREFVDIILSSADHMNVLIDTFLDISRIETGQLKLEPKAISLSKLMDEVVSEFKPVVDNSNIALKIKVSDRLPTRVSTDPLLTKEIYTNLLSNAIKYTPSGGAIEVTLGKKDDTILLAVKDTGYGIPANQQERIFAKFFRASNALSLQANGSGLGLYMIKKIAESMGGDIWFKSREGHGSTFFFAMPYHTTERKHAKN